MQFPQTALEETAFALVCSKRKGARIAFCGRIGGADAAKHIGAGGVKEVVVLQAGL